MEFVHNYRWKWNRRGECRWGKEMFHQGKRSSQLTVYRHPRPSMCAGAWSRLKLTHCIISVWFLDWNSFDWLLWAHHDIMKVSHYKVLDGINDHANVTSTHKLSVPHNSQALSVASRSLSSTRRAAQCSGRSVWSSRSRSRCRSERGFISGFLISQYALFSSLRNFRISLTILFSTEELVRLANWWLR